jgi:glucosamine--fructose-6-phosphate aminotransferase (isomerizing)
MTPIDQNKNRVDLETKWRDCSYLQDLLEQPDAVARTLAGFLEVDPLAAYAGRLRAERFRSVVLTGMGSSYWACRPLYLRLLAAGFAPVMVETSELIHYERGRLNRKNLVVAVSQSGRSAEIVRLMELAGGNCEVLGVTNTPDSPLGVQSACTLPTRAGAEHTVACKTYVATLLALEWLGDALCGAAGVTLADQARPAVESMRAYLGQWPAHVGELMLMLDGARHVFIVGRGPSVATAGTGGLILKESTHCQAEGMSAAAFRHGPLEMVSDAVFVLILEGDERSAPLSRKLAADIRAAGGRAAVVSPSSPGVLELPHASERMRPLMEILPVEMMTLALAAAKGREPGRFEHATKITETE